MQTCIFRSTSCHPGKYIQKSLAVYESQLTSFIVVNHCNRPTVTSHIFLLYHHYIASTKDLISYCVCVYHLYMHDYH